jgi:glycosyltransferase involved in cell wall biosynthesis
MSTKRKSVLLVSLKDFYGGGEVHLRNLAHLLGEHCDVEALVIDPVLAGHLRDEGAKVHRLTFMPGVPQLFQVIHAFLVLPAILFRNPIRVVQVTGKIETILLPLARLFGCTTVSVRHLVPLQGQGKWLRRFRSWIIEQVYGLGILFADRIVCVSETVGREMQKFSRWNRVLVIPNWVRYMPPKRELGEVRAPLRLLFVGRLESHKGLHLLLQALRGMSGYELTVVGEGSEIPSLRLLATEANVIFSGFSPDPSSYYRDADIFIMPSLGPEGLPLVTIEAMSHGLPCVLSDLPVHQEVSRNGDAALLFKSGDAESLRTQLQVLMNSELERMRFGDAAYRMVLQKFSPDAAAKAYLDAYGFYE